MYVAGIFDASGIFGAPRNRFLLAQRKRQERRSFVEILTAIFHFCFANHNASVVFLGARFEYRGNGALKKKTLFAVPLEYMNSEIEASKILGAPKTSDACLPSIQKRGWKPVSLGVDSAPFYTLPTQENIGIAKNGDREEENRGVFCLRTQARRARAQPSVHSTGKRPGWKAENS